MASKNKKRKHRRPKRAFTPEFRADVVSLCQAGDESIGKISERLDLTESAVRGWVARAEAEDAPSAGVGALSASAREELLLLRRAVKQLKMEREILKKAATFFAKESS